MEVVVGRRLFILITKLGINALALLLADQMITGIRLDGTKATIAAAVLLALVNTYLRPVILILTLPVNVLSLGLFTLVINAGMLGVVSWLLPAFHVENFWAAVSGALVISVVSFLLNWFLQPDRVHVRVYRQ